MKLCVVLGSVVATVKHPAFHGKTVLMCQPLDSDGNETGAAFIAVDHVQAGVGDRVLVNQEGNGSRQLLGSVDGKLPIRSVITGIVDVVSNG